MGNFEIDNRWLTVRSDGKISIYRRMEASRLHAAFPLSQYRCFALNTKEGKGAVAGCGSFPKKDKRANMREKAPLIAPSRSECNPLLLPCIPQLRAP